MIELSGFGWRLGNQLFQIAAAIGLAKKYNDTVYFPDWNYSRYFEGDFSNYNSREDTEYHYSEPHFAYSEIPYKKNMSINGYFQSPKYFSNCKKFIKQTFKLKPIETSIEILPNSCFIHVRRGDYVNLTQHHPLKTWDNYYKKAVEKIDQFFPAKYYIFSDELDKVKNEFPVHPLFEYVNGGDEVTDFYLMTKCQYQIIGNSSFSWWAAWLSQYDNTKTVAPKEWFGPAYSQHNLKDLFPTEWIVI